MSNASVISLVAVAAVCVCLTNGQLQGLFGMGGGMGGGGGMRNMLNIMNRHKPFAPEPGEDPGKYRPFPMVNMSSNRPLAAWMRHPQLVAMLLGMDGEAARAASVGGAGGQRGLSNIMRLLQG